MASAGKQAVDVFFVLSGFVIAHVCSTREHGFREYALSRAARIYSVAIPAVILTVAVDSIGIMVNPGIYDGAVQPMTLGLLVRCVLFVGEQWNAHRFPGCNGAYWSLGFEVWYYVAYGAFLFAPSKWRWVATAAVCAFIGPKVALMFPAWLMGVGVYRFLVSHKLSKALGWPLFIVPVVVFAAFQLVPHSHLEAYTAVTLSDERLESTFDDYFVCILFSCHIVGFSAVSSVFLPWLERHSRKIRWISGATFSIYLVHLPIMRFLAAISPFAASSPLMVCFLIAATPIPCFVFAELFERRKELWRSLIESTLRRCGI